MTNQEAIKWLNEAEILDLTSGNTKDRQAIDVAVEALEKQIQKKPQVIDNEFEKTQFFCPVCAYKLCGDDFCGDCGQAIDWSNDEIEMECEVSE